ncbi:MAG: electron transfer flavoprotein subunit alpha [Deltaproteobacteria bacterium]|nr:electron transfer flavoprotein subunit alpha [Deltaproteobacteria bacterium]
MLNIDNDKCNGCQLCQKTCPFGAIIVSDQTAAVDENCTLCGACVNVCPQGALSIERPQASPEELAGYQGVFVWAECHERPDGLKPKRVAAELLAQGRFLADKLGQDLTAVALGDQRLSGLDELCHAGVDRVIRCQHDLLGRYSTDGFVSVLSAVIAAHKPAVVLYGATPNGRDLAPRVAARLRLGLTADCTGLDIDDQGQLVQTRPAFGGNIMAAIVSPRTRPQTATVRPNVFTAAQPDRDRPVNILDFDVTLNKAVIRTKVVEEESVQAGGPSLDESKVIVAAGLGCQDPSGLDLARRLADSLGGVLACSRPLVELGRLPHTVQVGQSGTTVGPDLYVAVGISGAVQHLVGMSSSKTIVAINKDPEAPIFKVADLGVVGEATAVIPGLIDEIKRRRGAGQA